MADALDKLVDRAKAVQPLFITVDPARDTVDFLADYVSNFHPRLVGLTGSAEDIAAVAKAYRVFYSTVGDQKATDYRSAERRVGKECVTTCRARWSPNH